MSEVREFDATTKDLGDKIVGLTLLQAKARAWSPWVTWH